MSTDKLDMVLEQLREIRAENREAIAALHEKVNGIAVNGCSKGSWHDDHETRMRSVEGIISKASGAMAAIIAVSGIIGAVAGWASSLFSGSKGQ